MPRLPHLSHAMLMALLTGVGAAVIVALALQDSVPWVVKVPIALIGGGTIGLIAAGYAALGSENEEG